MNVHAEGNAEAIDLVAAADTGPRNIGGVAKAIVSTVAITWSLFQITLASPFSSSLIPTIILNNTRQIHLAFAIFLAFLVFPAFNNASRHKVPLYDWILAVAGAFFALYGVIFYYKLVSAGILADDIDKLFALAGLVVLFEATRRSLGPAMAIFATIFLFYVMFGSSDIVPEVIRWKGATLRKAMSHMWFTSEGVFGVAIGVSVKFVFLFVLFGAFLEVGGAGNYFIKLAFGALGHLRGGPAKAAVLGSAATGLISGSSIANVVTTGTFTIPLMKRVGFSSEQAGAVEVASSVNGQIMPPVMGAAAFLMVEYVGISYREVMTHAILPAAISYIALLYIVHLEAVKQRLPILGKKSVPLAQTLLGVFGFFAGFALLCYSMQYLVSAIAAILPVSRDLALGLVMIALYLLLIKIAAAEDDLEHDDPTKPDVELPVLSEIWLSGLYYLLPVLVLVYFLMIEQHSPDLSAFWATIFMIGILLTQRPLKAFFRGDSEYVKHMQHGFSDLVNGLIFGARNMIGIGLATATAGVIVGTVTLTGIGQVMADLVELASGGNLILMLMFVAFLSLILGMGLPTTANYIVVSTLLAGVVVHLGAASGFIVPLIAVHMFVFYFGIMADITPPVGVASFAAAALSGGNAIKTGLVAFFYSIRTIALPFMFIFNTDLLLIDVTPMKAIIVFVVATVAILIFTAGTMGWFLTKNRIYESVLLILVAFTLFRPGFFMDYISPPFREIAPANLEQTLKTTDSGAEVRLVIQGPDYRTGKMQQTTLALPQDNLKAGDDLSAIGLPTQLVNGELLLEEPLPTSPYFARFRDFDFYSDTPVRVVHLLQARQQPPKELFYIPAIFIFGLVCWLQRRRRDRSPMQSASYAGT